MKAETEEAIHRLIVAMYEWFGDRRTHAHLRDALARDLRVRYVVMDYVYKTRFSLICPNVSFKSLDAYIAATRDALVKALRAYECEAEACEAALRARCLAERQRQQRARAVAEARAKPAKWPQARRRRLSADSFK